MARHSAKSLWENKYSRELGLSDEEENMLSRFVQIATDRANAGRIGVNEMSWRPQNIALEADIDLQEASKNLLAAMWIEFLEITGMSPEYIKYKSVDAFLEAYSDHEWFILYDKKSKLTLMEIANWMNVMFMFESARKKKGLVMDVIPRLVEGPTAHYITGSGQTQATADRVKIYEREGGVSPAIRLKRRKAVLETKECSTALPARKRGRPPTKKAKAIPIELFFPPLFGDRYLRAQNMASIPVDDLTDGDDSDNASESDSFNQNLLSMSTRSANCCHFAYTLPAIAALPVVEESREKPTLKRMHSGPVWFEVLTDLGGPDNPVEIESQLNPFIFHPDLIIND